MLLKNRHFVTFNTFISDVPTSPYILLLLQYLWLQLNILPVVTVSMVTAKYPPCCYSIYGYSCHFSSVFCCRHTCFVGFNKVVARLLQLQSVAY